MKKRISFLVCIILVLSSLFLTSCGKEKLEVYDYTLYQMNTEGTALYEVGYNTDTSDKEELAMELINQLYIGSENADYTNSLPSNLTVKSLSIDGQILTISWGIEYKNLTGNSEILARAAVVQTMLQIPEIYAVTFLIEGEPLLDSSGSRVGIMNSDTFIQYLGEDNRDQETKLVLYYSSSDGQSLVKEERSVNYNTNTPLGRVVLEYLSAEPETEGAKPILSSNATVKSLAISDGTCYLTLDSSFQSQSEVTQNVVIYGIVNSLTELDGVSKVKFTIDGDLTDMALQFQQMDSVYERDLTLVQ